MTQPPIEPIKTKIEIDSKAMARFTAWWMDQWLYEGDPWIEWYRAEGSEAFFEWNKKRILAKE